MRFIPILFAAGILFAAPPPQGVKYAGAETCKLCHEEIYGTFRKTPHAVLANKACESCHGSGVKHADSVSPADIVNPGKLSSEKFNQACLVCHANRKTPQGRIVSGHASNQIACSSCHSVHGADGKPLVARRNAEINSQCAGCHISVWAAFQKPYKHRLPEAAMSCVDCHNPHASSQPQAMRASFANEPGCFRCHGDKRGPFTFEHAPVRMEGCGSCHEPHGSANPRMLTRHEVKFTCLECHANKPVPANNPQGNLGSVPPAFHDLRSPRYQNCTVCHNKVHGSYVNRAFLR